jgi:deazaflavin-dependent oxidoreductase (nitroreductase family)
VSDTGTSRPVGKRPFLPPRWFIVVAWAVHRGIFRLTGGRRGIWAAKPEKWGTMRLHSVGRKSGRERIAILGYQPDGENLVTVAMNGWGEGDPAWWLNLQAQPDVTVELQGETRAVRARAAEGAEAERLWKLFPGNKPFVEARRTMTPLVVLEPRSATERPG